MFYKIRGSSLWRIHGQDRWKRPLKELTFSTVPHFAIAQPCNLTKNILPWFWLEVQNSYILEHLLMAISESFTICSILQIRQNLFSCLVFDWYWRNKKSKRLSSLIIKEKNDKRGRWLNQSFKSSKNSCLVFDWYWRNKKSKNLSSLIIEEKNDKEGRWFNQSFQSSKLKFVVVRSAAKFPRAFSRE